MEPITHNPLTPGAELELWADTGPAPWMEHPQRAAALVSDYFPR